MIILRHNKLSIDDLFIIERILLKVSETSYRTYSLDYSLLNKPRAEVYGFIAGIFQRMNICQTLGITTSDFLDFLIDIEKGYNDNPYHSFYHAVDVAMVLYHMMEQYDMAEYLTKVDLAMAMIAALCHDIGHPGKNNHFEVSCKTEKAKLYKDLSVLESHSSSLALELLDKHQLLRNLESQTSLLGIAISKQDFKTSVVEMILATDMVCHFTLKDNISILHEKIDTLKHHSQVKKVLLSMGKQERKLKPLFPNQNPFKYFEKHFFSTPSTTTNSLHTTKSSLLNTQERTMLCKILIHAADISNPCRPWTVFHQQSRLVCVEFFRQGDAEESLGLPISPNMNRKEANPSSINVGFIDYIVQPYFEVLSLLFPKSKELLVQCSKNREEWLKLSTENVDIFGNKLLPIEVAMGGSITQVTIAAGTVEIPGKFEKVIRSKLKRSHSFNPTAYLSTDDNHLKIRRKSEEISLLYQRTRSPIGRRKSDASAYMSQPKMVSFSE